ncbi:MAG: hypothetical protein LBS50_02845, partial [Prevotellaceae bacterium]|nr:hypothetical protein [Prevotellaceae bacterium]
SSPNYQNPPAKQAAQNVQTFGLSLKVSSVYIFFNHKQHKLKVESSHIFNFQFFIHLKFVVYY